MNVRRLFLITASTTLLSGGALFSASAGAQDLFPVDDNPTDRVRLFESLEQPAAANGKQDKSKAPVSTASGSRSSVRTSQMSASEFRQARAMYRAQQRTARLEHNLWMGHEPLRPNWNSVPMMSSRYANRRIYVPFYVRTR